jgi:hypothetical protein
VFLHVGTTIVEPTDGATYEPTDGATTDPLTPSPGACASAAVPESANAEANAIVVNFMVLNGGLCGFEAVVLLRSVRKAVRPV